MKLPKLLSRDLVWLLVVAGILLTWLVTDTSLRRLLAESKARLADFETERTSLTEREEALARQEQDVVQQKEVYVALIKDVDVVKRKCEAILDDYADLKNKPRLGRTGGSLE